MKNYRTVRDETRVVPFLLLGFAFFCFHAGLPFISAARGQPPVQDDLEFSLDMSQPGIALPKIFSPSIDLSGRGFHGDAAWPQTLASPEAIESWQSQIGFRGMYRLQFNLWEISQLEKNKELQDKLLANYESVIKKISDAGAVVLLDIYGIPQGQGKVLDKTSSPVDPVAFKQLVKNYVRYFSCEKKYNIWYEVWSAPDLDEFFLGRTGEYLSLYRCVAEAVKELQAETKNVIPVGGPSSSWWFRSLDGSTVLTPERSLIYDLIKFCCHNKLPLDFISWHAYSTDQQPERGLTSYNKPSIGLIREWLSYFNFPKETPLLVDEWNFDSGLSNVLEERLGRANVAASYVMSRLKNMYEAELSGQVFFSLEDFQENKEGVVRNVGLFWYEPAQSGYQGGSKSVYNSFRMLGALENNYIPHKITDEYSGVIATRGKNNFVIIIYNYADPDIFRSFISRNIALLNEGERRSVIEIMKSGVADKIASRELDLASMRMPGGARNLFRKAQEVATGAGRFKVTGRQFRFNVKNMAEAYVCRRFVIDDSCSRDCPFTPAEEIELLPAGDGTNQKVFNLKPYSVMMLVLKPKPVPPPEEKEVPAQNESQALPPAEATTPVPAPTDTEKAENNAGAVNTTVTNSTNLPVPGETR